MDIEPRTIIAVRPASAQAARPRLLAALEAAFPVTFVPWSAGDPDIAAVLVFADDPATAPGHEALPTLVVGETPAPDARAEIVTVRDVASVDRRLRGAEIDDAPLPRPLRPTDGIDDVLAEAPSGAVWTRSRTPAPVHRVRGALPELADGEILIGLLWRETMPVVALVSFLREVTAGSGRRPAPLRAAFVFDDPNLRWRTYGFIDYRRLVAHADEHDYHASMAMIPLDVGPAHRPTLDLFRRRRDRLSLTVHGNDHVKRELLRPRRREDALALASQAMRRIRRFERSSGVPVDRIMMPPHGMCSPEIAWALGATGFDGLCAIHPRPWTGTLPADPPLAGWDAGEFVFGCAVIPRLHLHSEPGLVALHAFLDHPVILYAHHDDVADGLDPLAEAAARVNRLGDVHWEPVGDLALGNVSTRVAGDVLHLRPAARRVRVDVPDGVRAIAVDRPTEAADTTPLTGWSLPGGAPLRFGEAAPIDGPGGRDRVIVSLHGPDDVDVASVAAPAWRPWPLVRRVGTEVRDRALPLRAALAR